MKTPFLALLSFGIILPILSLQAGDAACCKTSLSNVKFSSKKMAAKLLKRFDADSDGSLDQKEIASMLEAHKRMCEKSRDYSKGAQVPKSAQIAPAPTSYGCAAKLLNKYDKDGDGKLNRKELIAMLDDCRKCGGKSECPADTKKAALCK